MPDGKDQCNLQGNCYDRGVNAFHCECDPVLDLGMGVVNVISRLKSALRQGWEGVRCDKDIDDCCQDPCAQGSVS